MISLAKVMNILALIIDFNTPDEAAALSVQLKSFHPEVCVVHVDNGNLEKRSLSAKQEQLGVELLRVPSNEGYAAGLVEGMRAYPNFESVWCLNSDISIDKDTLPRLMDVLKHHKRAGAVGPRVFKGKTRQVWGTRGVVNPFLGMTAMTDWAVEGSLPHWSYIPGSTLLIRKKAYDDIGGFDLRYRMYYEETDLCVRLQKKGWELWACPLSKAYHSVNSLKGSVPARHYAFYFVRNNLYFWKKNFNIPWRLQYARLLAVALKEIVLPLRRSPNLEVFRDRLSYVRAGLIDAREFLDHRYTKSEQRLFLNSQSQGAEEKQN